MLNETCLKDPCVDFEMYMLASLVVKHDVPVDQVLQKLKRTVEEISDGRLFGVAPPKETGKIQELAERVALTEEITRDEASQWGNGEQLAQGRTDTEVAHPRMRMEYPQEVHGHEHSSQVQMPQDPTGSISNLFPYHNHMRLSKEHKIWPKCFIYSMGSMVANRLPNS